MSRCKEIGKISGRTDMNPALAPNEALFGVRAFSENPVVQTIFGTLGNDRLTLRLGQV